MKEVMVEGEEEERGMEEEREQRSTVRITASRKVIL